MALALHRIAPLAYGLLRATGVTAARRHARRHHVPILCYHAVVPDVLPRPSWTQVRLGELRRQLAFLAAHYRVLPVAEIVARAAAGRPLPERAAAITFDDGYRNNLTHAFPVLRALGLPATIFLATGFVDGSADLWPDRVTRLIAGTPRATLCFAGRHLPLRNGRQRRRARALVASVLKRLPRSDKDRALVALEAQLGPPVADESGRPLSWGDVRQLSASGLVDFGAHTVSHQILARLTAAEQRSEIAESCARVGDMVGRPCELFAYPNGGDGDFDADTVDILRRLGLRAAFTALPGLYVPGSAPYRIPRVPVGAATGVARFASACAAPRPDAASSARLAVGR